MSKILTIFALVSITHLSLSAEVISYESAAPDVELTLRKSITGPVLASILSTVVIEPELDVFEQGDIFLRIDDSTGSWWVHTEFDSMDTIQFIDTRYLLLTLNSPASTSTAVLNLEDRSLLLIGSGVGTLLPSNLDDPLIQLNGRKGYSNGAFWYNSVIDIQGRVIEYRSAGDTCMPISEILLSNKDDISRLAQPLDDCIEVVR